MASIRLSPDVEETARQLSEEMGLGSLKTAIEAVFRTKWQDYRSGSCGCSQSSESSSDQGYSPASETSLDAASALDMVS